VEPPAPKIRKKREVKAEVKTAPKKANPPAKKVQQ
jgi:hypothetical protein